MRCRFRWQRGWCVGRVLCRHQVRVTPPAYTGEEATEQPTIPAAVIPGTTLDVVFKAASDQGELSIDARLLVGTDTSSLALQPSEQGMQAHFQVLAGTELHIDVVDQHGIPADPPFMVRIGTVPDRKPLAALSGVRRNEKITLQAVLPLQAEVRDDYGLEEVNVQAVVRKQG